MELPITSFMPTSIIARRAASLSGARPRLVWMMTPVALMVGRSVEQAMRPKRSLASATSSSNDGQGWPARMASLAPSSVSRSALTAKERPWAVKASSMPGCRSNRSTLGSLRSSSCISASPVEPRGSRKLTAVSADVTSAAFLPDLAVQREHIVAIEPDRSEPPTTGGFRADANETEDETERWAKQDSNL